MQHRRLGLTMVIATAAAVALAGCSSSGGSSGSTSTAPDTAAAPGGSSSSSHTVDGSGKTLTVWYMTGDYTAETMKAINDEFTKQTGAKVNLQVQQWNGITTKVSTALATNDPPDVVDMGNTQVASYAANGALADLTQYQDELKQGRTWLGGLVDPATVDGKIYGAPGFAGARSVIYNKTMWSDAGITAPPTTYDELVSDLGKIKAKHPSENFSPMYIPGQFWYFGLQFVWDAGGEIATEDNGKWKAGMESPEAIKGLKAFKKFQNEFSSKASRTLDTDKPASDGVFANGKAAAFVETNVYLQTVKKDNPKLTDADLGTFPFPGLSGKNQPVMLGGSDFAIAAKSDNKDLALEWIKIATSPEIQQKWVFGHDGWIPNTTEGAKKASAASPALQKAFFTAAIRSKATPANPNWTQIESTKAINQLFSDIASGKKSVKEAAADFDATADKILNSGS